MLALFPQVRDVDKVRGMVSYKMKKKIFEILTHNGESTMKILSLTNYKMEQHKMASLPQFQIKTRSKNQVHQWLIIFTNN